MASPCYTCSLFDYLIMHKGSMYIILSCFPVGIWLLGIQGIILQIPSLSLNVDGFFASICFTMPVMFYSLC